MFPKLSSKFQFSNRKNTISLLSTNDSRSREEKVMGKRWEGDDFEFGRSVLDEDGMHMG
jgi:hypothetical protein